MHYKLETSFEMEEREAPFNVTLINLRVVVVCAFTKVILAFLVTADVLAALL
jgi:hypothetical protein